MSGCPYTWFRSLIGFKTSSSEHAQALRVTVKRAETTTVDVTLPAKSAGWLIDLIPDDVVQKIRAEGIPLDDIQADLASREKLIPQRIFELSEPERVVWVWLE